MTTEAEAERGTKANLALLALVCSVIATVMESMAVSVALPAIARDFGVSAAAVTWVMGGAQMMIVALLLPMASLGDVVGYRRILLVSLAVFSMGSFLCMLAPGFGAIVLARVLQAIGTAGAMSLGFAMLRTVFSDARLGTAIGLMAATVAVVSSLGPAVSGLIMEVASWREIFGLMGLIGIVAAVLGARAWPLVAPSGRSFDLAGAALVVCMLTAALVVINGIANGWNVFAVVVAAGIFAGTLRAVLVRSRGTPAPVFPIDLWTRPVFALSVSASVCAFTAQTLGFILLPFHLIAGAGMAEWQMAAILSVWPATTALVAPVIGRLADRFPAGPTGAAGLGLLAIGFVLVSGIDPESTPLEMAVRLSVCGLGFGVFQTPNNRLVMLSAPRDRSGAASGTLSLARQFGRGLGTAIAAYVLIGGPSASLGAMLTAAAIAGLGGVASLGRAWARPVSPS